MLLEARAKWRLGRTNNMRNTGRALHEYREYIPVHQINQLAVGILVRDLVDLLQQADQHERKFQIEALNALGKRLSGRH